MAIVVETGVISVEVNSDKVPGQLAQTSSMFESFATKTSSFLNKAFADSHKTIGSLMQDLSDKIYRAFRAAFAMIPSMLRSLEGELTKLQGFTSSMSLTVGADKAQEQYEFLKKTANELGVSLSSLVENYGRLTAAMVTSGAPLKSVQTLFEGLTRASRSYHLSAQDTHWAMYAFTQIASKAKLSMEELNRQFGEKVPGALAIFAESLRGPLEQQLGKTGASIQELKAQLIDLVKSGKIDPIQFSIAVGPDLVSKFKESSEIAAKSVDSAINRLKNLWTDFANTVLKSGAAEKIASMFDAITEKLNDASIMESFASLLGDAATSFTDKIRDLTAEDIKSGFMTLRDALKSITEFMSSLITLAENVLPHLREIASLAAAISGAKLGASIGGALGGPWGAAAGAAAGGLTAGAGTYLATGSEDVSTQLSNISSANVNNPSIAAKLMSAYENIIAAKFGKKGETLPKDYSPSFEVNLATKGFNGSIIQDNEFGIRETGEIGRNLKNDETLKALATRDWQAKLMQDEAKAKLLFGEDDSTDKKAKRELEQLQKFMSGLDAGISGKDQGLSKSTVEELNKLDAAKKRLNLTEAEYQKYREYILATDPEVIKGQKDLQRAYEAVIKPLDDELVKLEEQNKYYGQTESQKQSLIIAEREEALARAYNSLSIDANNDKVINLIKTLNNEIDVRQKLAKEYDKAEANRLRDKYKTPEELYMDRRNAIDTSFEKGDISEAERDKFVAAELDAWKKIEDKAKGTTDLMSEFAKQAAKNMQDAMADLFFNVMQGNFDDLGTQFKKTLDRMVANAMAAQLGEALFGNMGKTGEVGGLAKVATDWVSTAAKAFFTSAHGNVVSGSGISALSNSLVSSPTYFTADRVTPFANGGLVGVAGEAGTEAIMPVTRDGSGNLGVSASGLIPNINININNTVSNDTQVTANARNNNGNIEIDVIVQKVIAKDMERNGPISRGFANTFGVARRS